MTDPQQPILDHIAAHGPQTRRGLLTAMRDRYSSPRTVLDSVLAATPPSGTLIEREVVLTCERCEYDGIPGWIERPDRMIGEVDDPCPVCNDKEPRTPGKRTERLIGLPCETCGGKGFNLVDTLEGMDRRPCFSCLPDANGRPTGLRRKEDR